MIDSVLKGTGNSRFLKSAVPAGTSWADALAMLQAGTFPIDFNGINTEGFQQVGTPLNKANLLKDATAARIGLPPSTPDGMFRALGNTGELHVWRKTITSGTGTYSLGAVQEGLHYIKWVNNSATSDSSGTFEYGSEIAVNNAGTITGIKNPSTITIKPWDDDASKANVFKGKFIKMISQVETSMSHFKIGEIWWIPADAVMTKGLLNGESGRWYIAASKRQQVVGVPAGTTTTYPVSTNPNAYQEGDDAKAAGYTLGEVVTGKFGMGTRYTTTLFEYSVSSEISVADNGTISLKNPTTFKIGGGYPDVASNVTAAIAGKYIQLIVMGSSTSLMSDPFSAAPSAIVYIPSDVTATREDISNGDNNTWYFIDRYQPVTGYAAIPAGTTIEYLGKLGDKARVQVVSYVGTGTYGKDNPCSITADFKINTILFLGFLGNNGNMLINNYATRAMIGDVLTTEYVASRGFSDQNSSYPTYGKKSADGKTFSWYHEYNTSYQCNNSGFKYYYLVISN